MTLVCINNQDVFATHAAGLEITYEVDSLNPGCYTVTVKFYRDCDGISAPTSLDLDVSSLSCGQSLSGITLNQVSSTEISPICPGFSTTCNGERIQVLKNMFMKGKFVFLLSVQIGLFLLLNVVEMEPLQI